MSFGNIIFVVLQTPKEPPKPSWERGHVNLLRDLRTGKQVLAFRCPGAKETEARGVLFFHGDELTHGSSETVGQYYEFECSVPWSEIKVELSL